MRRAAIALALGLALASFVLPQEPAGTTETKHESEQGDPWIWWKWANFLLLAGLRRTVRVHVDFAAELGAVGQRDFHGQTFLFAVRLEGHIDRSGQEECLLDITDLRVEEPI